MCVYVWKSLIGVSEANGVREIRACMKSLDPLCGRFLISSMDLWAVTWLVKCSVRKTNKSS